MSLERPFSYLKDKRFEWLRLHHTLLASMEVEATDLDTGIVIIVIMDPGTLLNFKVKENNRLRESLDLPPEYQHPDALLLLD